MEASYVNAIDTILVAAERQATVLEHQHKRPIDAALSCKIRARLGRWRAMRMLNTAKLFEGMADEYAKAQIHYNYRQVLSFVKQQVAELKGAVLEENGKALRIIYSTPQGGVTVCHVCDSDLVVWEETDDGGNDYFTTLEKYQAAW